MNCPRCEFENSPIALFCSTCGLKLSELPSHQALSFALEGKPASGKKRRVLRVRVLYFLADMK